MRRGKAKVAWEVVCLPKKEGGLGLRRLDIFNKALMVSHIWSLLSLKESLWVKWIHAYKLKGRNFWDVPIRGNMAWGWRKVLQIRPIIREFIWYRIGDGSKVSVWFDHWCPISPLSKIVSARDIHRAGFDMSTMIKDLFNNGQWTWPHDWISKYPALATIVVPNIVSNAVDELEWRDSSGTAMDFSVSSVWECIRPRGDEITWCDVVWFSNCIPRHAFHLWLVIKRKLKTQDNLRQWDVSSNTNLNLFQCPLCESQPDSHDHLFFECVFSLQVWNHMKIYAGTPRVAASLNAIIDHIIPMSKKKTTRSVIAKLVFVASTYFIWQERNYRLFKNQKRSPNQIIDCIKITVRLKLLTCRFKKTKTKMSFMHLWKLPDSLIYHDPNG
ncbi:GRF1-interacting factor 1-like protein [Tanacetum coccineum]